MTLQQSGAPVPAKKSIVVVRGTNRLSCGEAAHRLREERGEGMRRASHAHLRLRSPFMQETRVIKPFVALGESLEKLFRFAMAIRRVSRELVGNCQAEQAERELVFGLNCQDVAADRFCLFRFIERAVEFGF